MPDKSENDALARLESNQAELRRSIKASEELIARSDALLGRYRAEQEEENGPAR